MRHVARRRFGQHFLTDRAVIGRIVAAIDPRPADNMIEIGPGLGALTEPLLARVQRLHAIEIDRELARALRERHPAERLVVHEGDALGFDFSALPAPLRVVGNLPYNISTPLLFQLAQFSDRLQDLHVMLQREVVERMVAAPSRREYGRLSVALQYRFRMRRLFGVPAGAFRPVPKVESALVSMEPIARPERGARDEDLLARVVAQAFSHRRKTLKNALAGLAGAGELAAAGIDGGLRAENLAVADFVAIANCLAGADAVFRKIG
ncbi:MAG: 16S rRNA (adenine(1518)-N(6)/adenine(1519)-N(6))-dimethyltransferase RsmA [Betaproteobacteria bacterium]|nr:16S rRNA (adenine(1518)-N(6)/adenine(1519)-N(6))-dimethyltransferase RsmA [Betaproteobacteria bacterium]